MIKQNQIYRCAICGNVVEVIYAGGGNLVCCGQSMNLVKPIDIGDEKSPESQKHVPVIEKMNGMVKISVGEILHPMTEEHHIAWIELIYDGKIYRKFLKVGDKPEATFKVEEEKDFRARAYCNIHGLWGAWK
jgi:superoxide reductase